MGLWLSEYLPSCLSSPPDENYGGTAVILNVYDLTPWNHYTHWFGFGIFHSGIEGNSIALSCDLFGRVSHFSG